MNFHLNINRHVTQLLIQEDTDDDKKITIEDTGPKAYTITSTSGEQYIVKGTYFLSNLLQELVLCERQGQDYANINLDHIEELPTVRISRLIKTFYWKGLTRVMDESGIINLLNDTKNETLNSNKLKIYIPFQDIDAYKYYQEIERTHPIKALRLPKNITATFVKSLNKSPGILSLKLEKNGTKITGVPFVVPGGRFNEMYGWDSYFESIGLLLDGKANLAKAMADNFQYEIQHYGKILNANRSYYLTRTQPPFYSSLIREVFQVTQDIKWLKSHLKTAIKEYDTVWMVQGKRLTQNGLNRYYAEGIGMPPECEKGHFNTVIQPYAKASKLSIEAYILKYNSGEIKNNDLDAYFTHDRSVRESGHDTSYRLEGCCANLNTVELNALLYKYEMDFGYIIDTYFNGIFENFTSSHWFSVALQRMNRINKLMWNEERKQYFDYNFVTKKQSYFESASNYIPLWSGLVSSEKASFMVKTLMTELKEKGGIAGSSKQSTGKISKNRPSKQWDYPNGWAPHQIMIWKGLINYNYNKEAFELIYRWLYMIIKNAINYNGTIPEKYDVVKASHKVFAEYGNVGTHFQYITQEGFGWMNASFQFGLSLLPKPYITYLNQLIKPEKIFS